MFLHKASIYIEVHTSNMWPYQRRKLLRLHHVLHHQALCGIRYHGPTQKQAEAIGWNMWARSAKSARFPYLFNQSARPSCCWQKPCMLGLLQQARHAQQSHEHFAVNQVIVSAFFADCLLNTSDSILDYIYLLPFDAEYCYKLLAVLWHSCACLGIPGQGWQQLTACGCR